ncbi:hypothetical protein [uncultured Aquimarina sp.]|uniref:hypothetical protein n=1 Tax=uncultured Aquimarina sp. TaxID=575652 RepID=UPI00261B305A|nr:hypothetical protein [uncultured Aquimarina sp.]
MNKITVLFTITLLGLLFSCTADRLEDQTVSEMESDMEKRRPVIIIDTYLPPTTYAAGFERIWSSANPLQKRTATVWVNGVATALTDGTQAAAGNSVVVDAADNVYVAGFESNGTKNVAKLWVNGVVNSLTNGINSGSANSVFVDDSNNVYVGGYDGSNAKLWQIGGATQTFTPVETNNVVRITSVFKYNTDVYACGYEMSASGTNPNHKVWKNGSPLFSLGGITNNSSANSIFVSSGDVYVAGKEGTKAVVWKNGVPTYLSNGTYNASAKSVYVSGLGVHVAGYEYTGSGRVAKLWKNGVGTNLTTDVNGNAYASSVYVKNFIVFAGGTVRNPTYSNAPNVATVWTNNVPASWSTQNYEHEIFSIYAE